MTTDPIYSFSISEDAPLPNVTCDQEHCQGIGKDEQFYCARHNVNLCSVCRFAHQDCERDGLVCRGNREENGNIIINDAMTSANTVAPQIQETKDESWKELVTEDVVKQINEIFDDMPKEIILNMTYERFPEEIKQILLNESSRRQAEKNKICTICNKELIVEKTESGQSFTYCPDYADVFHRTGVTKEEIEIAKSEIETTTNFTLYFDSELKAIKFYKLNKSFGRKVWVDLVANHWHEGLRKFQHEAKIETVSTKIADPIKGEGKVISSSSLLCSHQYEHMEIPEQYRLVEVISYGKGIHAYCGCTYHTEKRYDMQDNNMNTVEADLDVEYFELKMQRLTSVFDRIMIDTLEKERFWKANSMAYKVDQLPRLGFMDASIKRFLVARYAKLSKETRVEAIEVDWTFSYYRYDKQLSGKEGSYVGKATKLNHYRARNDYAIFLTKPELELHEKLRHEARNPYVIPPDHFGRCVMKDAEQWEEDKRKSSENYTRIASYFGFTKNEITIGRFDGQIQFLCSLKRKK